MYKQAYANGNNRNQKDDSLFAANINPLVLSEGKTVIWQNPAPQSPLFVRPLLLQDAVESEAFVAE